MILVGYWKYSFPRMLSWSAGGKRGLLVLRWKAGTFAFNQVLYEAVVAAVALQSRPAGAFKELRVRCPLETEKAVAGFVEGLGRDSRVLCEDTPDDVGELGGYSLGTPDILVR